MALDDGAFDNEIASSLLKAFRENTGARAERDAIDGNLYSTGAYFDSVSNDSTVNVYLENPVDSGKIIFSHAIYRSGGQIKFGKVDSVTIDTAGTACNINNRLIDDGVSVATVEREVTASGGNQWTEKTTGGARGAAGLAPGESSGFDIILDEGDNVLYEATNTSGGEINMSIDVDYAEIDRDAFNEFVDE